MKDSTNNPKPVAPVSTGPTVGSAASPRNASAAPSKNTKLVKKKGAQAADPTTMAKPSRSKVTINASGGARYGVRVKMGGGVAPEAGATLANGRLFTAALNRTSPNFADGIKSSHRD